MKTIRYLIVAIALDGVWLAWLLWYWLACRNYSTAGILLAWAVCGAVVYLYESADAVKIVEEFPYNHRGAVVFIGVG